nr:hypothetical protein [Thermoflexibacter sp.]
MKEKILKEYPTVPTSLYVKRKADFSLAKVIKEMLRPAYISVARQMGKTNLILNAKRELEDENNLFVYIYLATEYRNARDCFRSIIDSIIEQYDNVFGNLREEIEVKRKNSNLLPADEYNSELKFLLSKYKGNIVIILDEVDYLAKDDFSDEIFGQIRKKYFIDNSFPVLKRLTYLLSGII